VDIGRIVAELKQQRERLSRATVRTGARRICGRTPNCWHPEEETCPKAHRRGASALIRADEQGWARGTQENTEEKEEPAVRTRLRRSALRCAVTLFSRETPVGPRQHMSARRLSVKNRSCCRRQPSGGQPACRHRDGLLFREKPLRLPAQP
jgi:hypothetical protein